MTTHKLTRPLLALAGLALSLSGCTMSSLPQAPDEVRWPFEIISGNTAQRAVQRVQDNYFPDERREGILYLVDHRYGRNAPYTDRYQQLAALDPDYTVRAIAIRALNIARDKAAAPTFKTALSDPAPLVRLEAAKALVNLPDPSATPDLLRLVADPQQPSDVRIAAADALQHDRRLEVARTLVNQLSSQDFAIAWQSLHSLIAMTGQNHGYNESAWLTYLTSPVKPLS